MALGDVSLASRIRVAAGQRQGSAGTVLGAVGVVGQTGRDGTTDHCGDRNAEPPGLPFDGSMLGRLKLYL